VTGLNKALVAFWAALGIPVYLAGKAPDGAAYPYVAIQIAVGDAFNATPITAVAWFKASSGDSANAARAAYLDAVSEAIPPQGARVNTGSGYLLLDRNDTEFMSYYDDPTDNSVIGARVSYYIRAYERGY